MRLWVLRMLFPQPLVLSIHIPSLALNYSVLKPLIPQNQARIPVEGLEHQPQNRQPTLCPANKMCWSRGGREIVGVANQ